MPISPLTLDLDQYVDAFESACEQGLPRSTDLRAFVPASGHAHYAEIVVELCRVDLERHWHHSVGNRLAHYQALFSDVFREPRHLEQLAFEEFRLRRLQGESVTPDEYARQLGLSLDSWPRDALASSVDDNPRTTNPGLEELSRLRPELAPLVEGKIEFPVPGESFLGFELLEELGRGAFGRVFLARQGDLAHRLVALKVTIGGGAEPQRLARLQHTHITPIFSVHRSRQFQAVCMPFLGRRTLADLIRSVGLQHPVDTVSLAGAITRVVQTDSSSTAEAAVERSVSTNESQQLRKVAALGYVESICWIMSQIAGGLSHAHDRGVLHCDLKPANILLSDDGVPIILDFNTAQEWSRAAGASALVGGTLPYMSPEQLLAFQGSGSVDQRSDIYSLGVVFYELLTGRHPFPMYQELLDESLARMLADRRTEKPMPRRHVLNLSPAVQAIVQKCLCFAPGQRYQTAQQLCEDLTRHVENRPLRHVPEPSIRERTKKWTRRHPKLSSLSLITTVAMVAIGALGFAGWEQSQRVVTLQAKQTYLGVIEQLPVLWVEAAAGPLDRERRAEFEKKAKEIYRVYGVDGDTPWFERDAVTRLAIAEQNRIRREVAGVLYLDTELQWREAQFLPETERTTVMRAAQRRSKLAIAALPAGPASELLKLQSEELAWIGQSATDRTRPISINQDAPDLDKLWTATSLIMRNKVLAAEPLLQQISYRNPQDFAARFLLGNCQARLGNGTAAEGSYSACIALRPHEYAGWYHRGLLRLDRHDHAGALDDFSAVLRCWPQCVSALVNRALAWHGCGETARAIEDLSLALERGAPETRIWLLRSKYRRKLGDAAGAEADYAEWLRRTPTDELSWVTRGTMRIATDPRGAKADLEQGLRLNPNSRTALQNLAHVLAEQLNDRDGAVAAIDAALGLSPDDSVLLGSRAVLLARMGRNEAALADAEAATRGRGDVGFTAYQVACVHALLSSQDASQVTPGMRSLARAFATRPDLVELTSQDKDLDALRIDPRFADLVAAAKQLVNGAKAPSAASSTSLTLPQPSSEKAP